MIRLSMTWCLDLQTQSRILTNLVARTARSVRPEQFDPELTSEGLMAGGGTSLEGLDCLSPEAQPRWELSQSLNKLVIEFMNRSTEVNSAHIHAPVRRHDNQPFLSVPCHT